MTHDNYNPTKPVSYYQRQVDNLTKTSRRPPMFWILLLVLGVMGVMIALWHSSWFYVILTAISAVLIVTGVRFLNLGGLGGVSPMLEIAERNLARRKAEEALTVNVPGPDAPSPDEPTPDEPSSDVEQPTKPTSDA